MDYVYQYAARTTARQTPRRSGRPSSSWPARAWAGGCLAPWRWSHPSLPSL